MADARSLLRAQRAARRINHPHALYTDSGKLTCAVCHEPIKSDAQWDSHVRGVGHRQRLLAQQKARAAQQAPQEPAREPSADAAAAGSGASGKSKPGSADTPSDEALLAQIISGGGASQKRKHPRDQDDDAEMADAEPQDADGAARSKRSRHDAATAVSVTATAGTVSNGSPVKRDSPDASKSSRTPPGLVRRISGTPSHGVELQIPSRPATPSASATSATSTPKATPMGRSPLIPQDSQMSSLSGSSKPAPKAAFVTPAATEQTQSAASAPGTAATSTANDDDDWAAFEAEVVHAAPEPGTAAGAVGAAARVPDGAVISAAPLTAEQLAAKSEEEEREKRRMQADVDLEDEKEEATRALEAEFEEMEELEARVRKLKEKREAIRRGSVTSALPAVTTSENKQAKPLVNGNSIEEKEAEEEDEDDDEEEDEEDDWAGFRFRA